MHGTIYMARPGQLPFLENSSPAWLCQPSEAIQALGKTYIYSIYYFFHNYLLYMHILGIILFEAWPSPFK